MFPVSTTTCFRSVHSIIIYIPNFPVGVGFVSHLMQLVDSKSVRVDSLDLTFWLCEAEHANVSRGHVETREFGNLLMDLEVFPRMRAMLYGCKSWAQV